MYCQYGGTGPVRSIDMQVGSLVAVRTRDVYLYRHRFLHMLWSADLRCAFLTLSLNDQRAIHDYYRPAESLADEELLKHRAAFPAESSLPQRAG